MLDTDLSKLSMDELLELYKKNELTLVSLEESEKACAMREKQAFEAGCKVVRHIHWVNNCIEAGYNEKELAEVESLAPPYTDFDSYKTHLQSLK